MRNLLVPALIGVLGVAACQSTRDAQLPEKPPAPVRAFDSQRAFADLVALTGIGPRPAGSDAADRARAYLRAELGAQGLQIVEYAFPAEETDPEGPALHDLLAAIPGEASDVIVVATPYDTREIDGRRFVGANEGASGAAVALELARTLARTPLPYTVWFAFFEGKTQRSGERETLDTHLGARAFARHIHRLGAEKRLRLSVVLERVCDADLQIARDLRSDRAAREQFWQAARRLGYEDAFPSRAPYSSPSASHLELSSLGLAPVVALVDDRFGGGDPPGDDAGTERDTPERCAPESLGTVGEVTLAALESISERLARIDRVTRADSGEELRLDRFPYRRASVTTAWNETVRVEDVEGTRQLLSVSGQREVLQSTMDLAEPHRLVDGYTKVVSLLTALHPEPQRVFDIGLGGGVLPRFHLHHYPASEVESVEIDPVILRLAREFFEVEDPRHTLLEGDGAVLLLESDGDFDVIWVDAYTTDGVPEVFKQRSFLETLPTKLAAGGFVVANLWEERPEAFDRLVADYKRGFSHGLRVSVPGGLNHIIAVGESPELRCEAFQRIAREWSRSGLVDLGWTEADPPPGERCRDL